MFLLFPLVKTKISCIFSLNPPIGPGTAPMLMAMEAVKRLGRRFASAMTKCTVSPKVATRWICIGQSPAPLGNKIVCKQMSIHKNDMLRFEKLGLVQRFVSGQKNNATIYTH